MPVEEFHTAQGITGALEEQKRDFHVGEVGYTQLLRFPGRVQWVCVKDNACSFIAFGHQVGSHPAAHRAAAQKQEFDGGAKEVCRTTMTLNQPLGAIGTSRSSLGVGIVEGHDTQPCGRQAITQGGHQRVVLVGSRSMSKHHPDRARAGNPA